MSHSIYIYRDDSGRACYVGYGQSSDEALANMAATHHKSVRELLKSQSLTLEIAGPFESKETALAVESALISALAPAANSAHGQMVHRFRPLGVPPQFAERVAMAPLGRDDLIEMLDEANSPTFLCVYLDSLDFPDESGYLRRGFEPSNPPSDDEILERVRGWWRLQTPLEDWRRHPMQSPAILLGVHGKPENQFIVASVFTDREGWDGAQQSEMDEDCYEVPVADTPQLDAAQLRGRRISRKAGLKFNADGVKGVSMTSKIPMGNYAQCGAPNLYENQGCTQCGATLPWARVQKTVAVEEIKSNSVLLNIFSFLIPIIGIAAWLILMSSEPDKSREAGISALLGILVVPFVMFVVMPMIIGR